MRYPQTRVLRTLLVLLAVAGLLIGCAPKKETYLYPFPTKIKTKKGIARIRGVINEIRVRNKTVENDPEWIKRSYESLRILDLMDIPEDEYARYAEYARGGRAFIIVHPAFYTFFTTDASIRLEDTGELHPDNLVERLYAKKDLNDIRLKVMQEQEKAQRDFMEVLSIEEILVVVVVPKDYKDHEDEALTRGRDEYTRFLNEITNESESIVYIESKKWDRGGLDKESLDTILDFLIQANVKRIYVGGGYVGRCLGEFYDSMDVYMRKREYHKYFNFYMVPELAAISPIDLRGTWITGLYSEAGINYNKAAKNLRTYKAYGVQRTIPRIKRFYVYEFEFSITP